MALTPADRAWIKDAIQQAVANMLRLSPVAKSNADGEQYALEGHKQDPSDPSYEYDALYAPPFGVHAVVPAGVEAVWVQIHGGASNNAIVGTHSTRYAPSDLKDGEVAFYNKVTGCTIKLDENGKLTIDAAAGQDVVVNGGTLKVARVTDATTGHAHAAGTYQAGPYTVIGSSATQTDTIASSAGATRFKG